MRTRIIGLWLVGLMTCAGVAAGAAQIAALADVAPGEWQLKEIGGTASKSVCIADPAQLFQVHHAGAACKRTIIDSEPKSVTVEYTCASGGNGRTTLIVRSAQSIKLETQGMAGGGPFAFDYDAKRTGDCTLPGETGIK